MEIGEHITQVALALALIVALVVALGFVLRRIGHVGVRASGEIKIVASAMLGPKERVVLLQLGDRQVLVGMNAQCIRALTERPAPASADTFAGALKEVGLP